MIRKFSSNVQLYLPSILRFMGPDYWQQIIIHQKVTHCCITAERGEKEGGEGERGEREEREREGRECQRHKHNCMTTILVSLRGDIFIYLMGIFSVFFSFMQGPLPEAMQHLGTFFSWRCSTGSGPSAAALTGLQGEVHIHPSKLSRQRPELIFLSFHTNDHVCVLFYLKK